MILERDVVLIGQTNAGKTTLGRALSRRLTDTNYFSTGDEFRRLVSAKDPRAIKLKRNYFDKGLYAPDADAIEIITPPMLSARGNGKIILDGFPRRITQARVIEELLPGHIPLYLFAEEDTLLKRAANRLICSSNRCQETYNQQTKNPKIQGTCDYCFSPLQQRDDDPNLIKKRLEEMKSELEHLRRYYGERWQKIDASLGEQETLDAALKLLRPFSRNA